MNEIISKIEYCEFLLNIKAQIKEAQARSNFSGNKERIRLLLDN
ncbi:MAG: hypothetical protein ABIA04_07955 [Pseudomonadota bacterium]